MQTATTLDPFPPIDAALIERLERVFPDRCPDGKLTNDEIRERIGEARVLRFLKHQRARQQAAAATAAGALGALSRPEPRS